MKHLYGVHLPKEMYECPILMIDITPAETVVMPCCCHVVSQRALESVRNNACPFCREQLGVGVTAGDPDLLEDAKRRLTKFYLLPVVVVRALISTYSFGFSVPK